MQLHSVFILASDTLLAFQSKICFSVNDLLERVDNICFVPVFTCAAMTQNLDSIASRVIWTPMAVERETVRL